MFKLQLETDLRWLHIAEKDIQKLLTDHAYCEQKAASSAISIIVKYPEKIDLVKKLTEIAIEEMTHFQMVVQKIQDRNMTLGREEKDLYVHDLFAFFSKGGNRKDVLVNRLLISAMIEARSCERFRLLSKCIKDKDLADFYCKLMISEAEHYKVFLSFARQFDNTSIVNEKWKNFLEYEKTVIQKYNKKATIHG